MSYPEQPAMTKESSGIFRKRSGLRRLFSITVILGIASALPLRLHAQQHPTSREPDNPKVILAYPLVEQWLKQVEAHPDQDRHSIFEQTAIAPIVDKCFPNSSADDAMKHLEFTIGNPADWGLPQVQREVKDLAANSSAVKALIQKSIGSAERRLPSTEPVTVCVFYLSPYWGSTREQFNGSFGFTPSGTVVQLFVAPTANWLHWLPGTAAHEYHHAVTRQLAPELAPSKPDLLDTLLFEGRADHFANLVTGLTGPWTDALPPGKDCELFTRLLPQLHDTKLSWYALNQSRAGQFPQWAGYTIAYRLVGSYLHNHPHIPIRTWTLLSPAELLAESGYGNHCKPSGASE
jgi:uncharacterized protein YjaZ